MKQTVRTSALKVGPDIVTTSADEHNSQASVAANHEHNLSFHEALSSYPTAIAWSIFFSLGVIMAVNPTRSPSSWHRLIDSGIRPPTYW